MAIRAAYESKKKRLPRKKPADWQISSEHTKKDRSSSFFFANDPIEEVYKNNQTVMDKQFASIYFTAKYGC